MQQSSSTFGAYDAKTHFSEILQRVEGGEEIIITRHGTPIAQIVPVGKKSTVDQRREAIAAIRALSGRNRLRGLNVNEMIAEGRK